MNSNRNFICRHSWQTLHCCLPFVVIHNRHNATLLISYFSGNSLSNLYSRDSSIFQTCGVSIFTDIYNELLKLISAKLPIAERPTITNLGLTTNFVPKRMLRNSRILQTCGVSISTEISFVVTHDRHYTAVIMKNSIGSCSRNSIANVSLQEY